jgi:hypothetical protein
VAEPSELRQFMRDIARRHERIWREQRQELLELRAEVRASREESRRVIQGLREVQEDSRAHTRALLHVLDRLENGGAAA